MTKRKRQTKSPLPFYGAAAVCIVYVLVFPFYKLWHALVMLALAAVCFVLLEKLMPEKTTEFEILITPKTTGDPKADSLIYAQRLSLEAIVRDNDRVRNEALTKDINRLEDYVDDILYIIERKPEDSGSIRLLVEYYLPTLLNLFDTYLDKRDKAWKKGDDAGLDAADELLGAIMDIVPMMNSSYGKMLSSLREGYFVDLRDDIREIEEHIQERGLIDKAHESADRRAVLMKVIPGRKS